MDAQALDGSETGYEKEHIEAAVSHELKSFDVFFAEILKQNEDDPRFHLYADKLLYAIYEGELRGRYLSKSEACRFIPIGASNTCRKYVDEAERRGFVKFVRDETTRRRVNVVPTKELHDYVKYRVEEKITEARNLLDYVAKHCPMPADNKPLAEYRGG